MTFLLIMVTKEAFHALYHLVLTVAYEVGIVIPIKKQRLTEITWLF